MTEYRTILLVQLGDVGDVVLTTPTVRAVKETYPDARVSIMVRKPYGSLLAADPYLFEVVEAEKFRGTAFHVLSEYVKFARRLHRTRYDLVIDLRTGDRGALMTFLTGAPVRVGSLGGNTLSWHNFTYTKIIRDARVGPPDLHQGADQSLRLVRTLGINTEDSLPRLYIAPKDREQASALLSELGLAPGSHWITINPFSRWNYKEWGKEKWGKVIDRIWNERRIPSVLIGSRDEVDGCSEITAGREDHAFTVAGETTLGELAAVIAASTLHTGVDSAAPHIAAAVGTPTVTIHGPTNWRAWRMVDDRHRVVSAAMDCVPCSRMGCNDSKQSRCLESLTAEPVISSILELLSRLG